MAVLCEGCSSLIVCIGVFLWVGDMDWEEEEEAQLDLPEPFCSSAIFSPVSANETTFEQEADLETPPPKPAVFV